MNLVWPAKSTNRSASDCDLVGPQWPCQYLFSQPNGNMASLFWPACRACAETSSQCAGDEDELEDYGLYCTAFLMFGTVPVWTAVFLFSNSREEDCISCLLLCNELPRTQSLRPNTLVISQSPWVRNPGVTWLDSLTGSVKAILGHLGLQSHLKFHWEGICFR